MKASLSRDSMSRGLFWHLLFCPCDKKDFVRFVDLASADSTPTDHEIGF